MAVVQKLNVNGKPVSITVEDPEMPLLYALRGNLSGRFCKKCVCCPKYAV